MEKSFQERTNLPSPSSCGNSSSNGSHHNHYNNSSSSMVTSSDGVGVGIGIGSYRHHHHHHNHSNPSTPRTPTGQTTRSDPNSNNNPYPTTFVQADTTSFKQVVQMLTGSTETVKLASTPPSSDLISSSSRNHHQIPPIRPVSKPKPSRLLERRNSQKAFRLSPLIPGTTTTTTTTTSHNNLYYRQYPSEILSPSILDFPSLVLSPVTPLIPDPFNRSSYQAGLTRCAPQLSDKLAEEKAIAEKGFYLHRSPATTPRDSSESPPTLLPLFPVTSPRVSGSSASD